MFRTVREMACWEGRNSTPEALIWPFIRFLFCFVCLVGEVKDDHRHMRVPDQILVEIFPVIFPANETHMFMWVCGLVISCLRSRWAGDVCICRDP